jgi:hypothetical protein
LQQNSACTYFASFFSQFTARVMMSLGHMGFVVDKMALEHVFSEFFGFP